jgi:hypothetical protein
MLGTPSCYLLTQVAPGRTIVAVIGSIRVLPLLFLATCAAAQQIGPQALPDAPSTPSVQPAHRVLSGAARSAKPALSSMREPLAWHFDPGHFNDPPTRPGTVTPPFENALLVKTSNRYRASDSDNLFARAIGAAWSTVIARGEDGSSHLNSSYLLKVLTSAAAQTAERPYWRRSASQPFADIGSTIGNDAGMNVLHEFQPGILQLVKNHQPRFFSKITGTKQDAGKGPGEARTLVWKPR